MSESDFDDEIVGEENDMGFSEKQEKIMRYALLGKKMTEIESLIRICQKVDCRMKKLHFWAASCGHFQLLKRLLEDEMYGDLEKLLRDKAEEVDVEFEVVCSYNDEEENHFDEVEKQKRGTDSSYVEEILENYAYGRKKMEIKFLEGDTLLLIAARERWPSIVRYLLDKMEEKRVKLDKDPLLMMSLYKPTVSVETNYLERSKVCHDELSKKMKGQTITSDTICKIMKKLSSILSIEKDLILLERKKMEEKVRGKVGEVLVVDRCQELIDLLEEFEKDFARLDENFLKELAKLMNELNLNKPYLLNQKERMTIRRQMEGNLKKKDKDRELKPRDQKESLSSEKRKEKEKFDGVDFKTIDLMMYKDGSFKEAFEKIKGETLPILKNIKKENSKLKTKTNRVRNNHKKRMRSFGKKSEVSFGENDDVKKRRGMEDNKRMLYNPNIRIYEDIRLRCVGKINFYVNKYCYDQFKHFVYDERRKRDTKAMKLRRKVLRVLETKIMVHYRTFHCMNNQKPDYCYIRKEGDRSLEEIFSSKGGDRTIENLYLEDGRKRKSKKNRTISIWWELNELIRDFKLHKEEQKKKKSMLRILEVVDFQKKEVCKMEEEKKEKKEEECYDYFEYVRMKLGGKVGKLKYLLLLFNRDYYYIATEKILSRDREK